jgi:hypothetical protein
VRSPRRHLVHLCPPVRVVAPALLGGEVVVVVEAVAGLPLVSRVRVWPSEGPSWRGRAPRRSSLRSVVASGPHRPSQLSVVSAWVVDARSQPGRFVLTLYYRVLIEREGENWEEDMRGLIAAPLSPSSLPSSDHRPSARSHRLSAHSQLMSIVGVIGARGNTLGMTWPQFLTYCRTHTGAWSAESSPNSLAPTQASATAGTKSHHTKHPKRPTVQPASAPAAPTECKSPKTMNEYYQCRAMGEAH